MGNSLYFSIKGGVLTRLDSETEIRPGTVLRFSFEDNWGAGAKSFALFRGAADGTYYGQALVNNMCTIPVCMVERAEFFVSVSTGMEETNPVQIRNSAVGGPVSAEELREMMQKLNEAGNAADAVRYSAQELTDAQKEQARTNIGAAAVGEGAGMVVTVDTNGSSKTSAEIVDHVKTGGSVVLKRGEDLYNFANYAEDTGGAYFIQTDPMDGEYIEIVCVSGNKVFSYKMPFALESEVAKITAQTLTEEQKAQARSNIDALGTAQLPTAVNTALAQAKASGEFDGEKGEDGEPGKDGKSAYQYAQDGGYTGTEEEFAAKLAQGPLVGTTAEITPTQVKEAIEESRAVAIKHTATSYGEFTFNAFSLSAVFGVVYATGIVDYAGTPVQVGLYGQLSNNAWFFSTQILATRAEIPTSLPNPGNLTFKPGVNLMFTDTLPIEYSGEGAKTVYIPTKTSHLENDSGFLTAASGGIVPDYVRTEAERLAKLVQSRKNADTVTFLVCSDLHHSYELANTAQQTASILHCGQAMGLIREAVQIDFAAMLGDTVWDNGETVENALKSMRYVNSCLHKGFAGIPNFRTRGNHECLYNNDTGLTDAQIFANILSFNTGANYDDNNRLGGYCYKDFPDYKLRVVCINTSEDESGGCVVSSAQNTWLQSALDLSALGDGWRSIVLGHHPPDWVSSGSNLVQTLKAASGLIAVFHGHVHGFKVDTITGTEITRIAIPNACYGRENEYGTNGTTENNEGTEFGEETTYRKTAGTAEDTAFCVITIDLAEKKIYADHYGAGYDRVVAFDDVVLESYPVTNNLTNVTNSNAAASVTEGAGYSATLTAADGYALKSVTVTMGGVDVTASAYSGGKVNISSVTGAIVITATAEEKAEDSGNYTNLLSTAQAMDSTEPYNGTGYKDGYRLSSSSPYESAAAGYVLTGYIPYPVVAERCPSTIYIKGCTWENVSGCRLYFFTEAKNSMCGPQINGNGTAENNLLSTFYTMETLGENYFRLIPKDTGTGKWTAQQNVASVTDTEFFRISLAGSGENLIVTVNEPIE